MVDIEHLRELLLTMSANIGNGFSPEDDIAEILAYVTGAGKTQLDYKTALRIAKESYASSSDEKEVRNSSPVPAPYITMTGANLVKFFQLASKGYKP